MKFNNLLQVLGLFGLLMFMANINLNAQCTTTSVSTFTGETNLTRCPQEIGASDVIRFKSSRSGTPMAYLVTDETNNILQVSASASIDLSSLGAGTFRVWGFSYAGQITAQIGVNAATTQLASICSILSNNFVTITNLPAGECFTLQVLHNNDGESKLTTDDNGVGGAAAFKTVLDELRAQGYTDITLSSGDNFLPGPQFNASLELDEAEDLYDAVVLKELAYDAICLGNHDFDFGPDVLERLITDVNAGPSSVDNTNTVGGLNFLGDFSIPTQTEFNGTTFGGLSSIDYDPSTGTYYLICDDPSGARYYTANIDFDASGINNIEITGVVNMQETDGSLFADGSLDPEAIRFDPSTGTLYWTSEGNVNNNIAPFVREMNIDGSFVKEFNNPSVYDIAAGSGPRQNGVFEGITITTDGAEVVTMLELPLIQDGVVPDVVDTNSPVRMQFFDKATGEATRQYAYELDPVAVPGQFFQINGVVEVLAVDANTYLVMERSAFFSAGSSGNTVKIFRVTIGDATEISAIDALAGEAYTPVCKELVIEIDDSNIDLEFPVDNIEGMTFGPDLANGSKTLVLVADDNFSAFGPQVNQFLAFEITPQVFNANETGAVYLSANIDFTGEAGLQALVDEGVIAKSATFKKGGEYIGVIGLTTPNLPFISSPRNATVSDDLINITQAEVNTLTATGVNKIILVSHLQSITEELELATSLTGVDIIIAGGGDELLTNDPSIALPGVNVFGEYPLTAQDANGQNVYVVTTPGEYNYLGQLVVTFNPAGEVVNVDDISDAILIKDATPNPFLQENVIEPVLEYVNNLATNVIATTEVDLDGLRGNVRTVETNEGNLIADALLWQARELAADFGVNEADVAFQNGGGIRNNNIIPAGSELTTLTTFDMLPFPNFVTVLEDIPATQFKEILENAVSRVESVSGRFTQVAGCEVVWDEDGAPQSLDGNANVTAEGSRIVKVTLDNGTVIIEDGEVVNGAPSITIATIDFLARGGDQYPYRGVEFTVLGVTYQQALENYLVNGLGGVVTADQYPEGGEGRIVRLAAGLVQNAIQNTLTNPNQMTFDLAVSPNPTTEELNINYTLEIDGQVEVTISDVFGKTVATLANNFQVAGQYQLNTTLDVPAGTYFVTVIANGEMNTLAVIKK